MSFLDHLEELRWHLIRSLISIGVFSIAAFLSKKIIFHDIVLAPARTDFWTYQFLCRMAEILGSQTLCIDELPFILQSRQLTGQFTMHVASSLVIGLIVSFPYVFWEFWRFMAPGLYPKERKASRGATFFVSLLFMMGVSFGYYIISPLSINFLSNYSLDTSISNEFDIISYVSTISMIVLACALMFQLPIVVYFLSKAGLVSPQLMKRFRRHSIVVILVISAILTPPDIISQILIAIPLLLLYEVSIIISRVVLKRAAKREIAKA